MLRMSHKGEKYLPTIENSSAKKRAISSPASGELLSGLNSMRSVSMTRRIVSTSPTAPRPAAPPPPPPSPWSPPSSCSSPSPSRFKVDMSSRKDPLATDAGYCFAKLRSPRMAARRSSRSVADCSRPHNVSMVAVAVCRGGVLSIIVICCCPEAVSLLLLPHIQLKRCSDDGSVVGCGVPTAWSRVDRATHHQCLNIVKVSAKHLSPPSVFLLPPSAHLTSHAPAAPTSHPARPPPSPRCD